MKNKNILKKITKCLLVATFLVGNMIPAKVDLQAATVRQYFWSSLYDSSSRTFVAKILEDDIASPDEGTYSRLNTTEPWFEIKDTNTINKSGILANNTLEGSSGKGNRLDVYPYTFPGTITNENQVSAMAQDQQMASYIANTLTTSFNNAIIKISTGCGLDTGSLADKEFLHFATKISNSAGSAINNGTAGGSYKGCSWTFTSGASDSRVSAVANGYGKGTNKNDFVILSMNGKDTGAIYQVRAPKGYSDGQHLASTFEGIDKTGWMNEKLSWAHVLYQAKYSYANNVTADTGNEAAASPIEKAIAWLFSGLVNQINGMLGLFPLDELMLNTGNRSTEYYEGTMPRGWFSAVSIIYVLCMAVALIVIGYAIVKLMIQKNLSTINATQKVSLMEGVKDLAITAGMLSLFYPAFLIVCKFNSLIVSGLASLVMDKRPLQEMLIGNGGTGLLLGSIVIACVMLFICLKVNITYIIRSLTIAILFATSPYFISTYSIPGKKEKFWSWLKEMLANIFMQSFDAIIAVILISIMHGHPMRVVERLALALALTSLSSFFKNSIIRMGSDSEDVAGRATGLVSTGLGNALVGLGAGIGRKTNNSTQSKGDSSTNVTDTNASSGDMINKQALDTIEKQKDGSYQYKETLSQKMERKVPFISEGKEKLEEWSEKLSDVYEQKMPDNAKDFISKSGNSIGKAAPGIAKGIGHAVGSTLYTGIAMGTQAVGGRTFMGERKAYDSISKAQDEFWDNGIMSGYNEAVSGAGYDDQFYVQSQLEEGGIFDVNTINKPVSLFDGKTSHGDKERYIENGLEIDVDNNNYTRDEAINIANNLNPNNDGVYATYKDPNTSEVVTKNLSVKEFKNVAQQNTSNDLKLHKVYRGGLDYQGITCNKRPVKDNNGRITNNSVYEIKHSNGQIVDLDNMNYLAGRIK